MGFVDGKGLGWKGRIGVNGWEGIGKECSLEGSGEEGVEMEGKDGGLGWNGNGWKWKGTMSCVEVKGRRGMGEGGSRQKG